MQIHRAKHILVSPWHIIENGYIAVVNNTIIDVGSITAASSHLKSNVIDHGSGVIMPALLNAHTHFELSALQGKISFDKGFNNWVRELIKSREECTVELISQKAKEAIDAAILSGTYFACEISTLGITKDIFADSDIGGIWFKEYLGSNLIEKDLAQLSSNKTHKKESIAGHAPHTTSPAILNVLKKEAKIANLPFSIHVAESTDETEFITTKKGSWADFLKERGIDTSLWGKSRSPVQHLDDIGLIDNLTLLIHLLNVDTADIEIIANRQAKPIFCPRSNFNLHKKLPDIPLFLKYGLKPALGTDSLASTETLNMFDEMLYVAKNFSAINPSEILAMATTNSADALCFSKVAGSLEKGKLANFIYLPLDLANKNLSDSIISIIDYRDEQQINT
ncbi:MAG: amidohydrolase family protein [Desulfamplus sp.]|nr:amidohydrolase family protein [Desulfamplus sp.]